MASMVLMMPTISTTTTPPPSLDMHMHMLRTKSTHLLPRRLGFGLQQTRLPNVQHLVSRQNQRVFSSICDVSQESLKVDVDKGITVASTDIEDGKIKMKVGVSGAKTEAIFESVFSRMVSAAQPIPGFRRVKGGKTPNIHRDVLIQILGPSKVYKQVIKKIINSTVAEYVEKQKLKVTKDLRVEQSFEELEDVFEPGEEFSFDATLHLREE